MGPPRAPQGPIGPQRARIKAHGSNFEPPGSEFEPGAQIMGPILGPDGRPTSFVRKYYSLRPYLFSLWCGQSLTDARQIPGLQHGVVSVDNPSVATSAASFVCNICCVSRQDICCVSRQDIRGLPRHPNSIANTAALRLSSQRYWEVLVDHR